MIETFGEDYFLRGPTTGLSNYTNYQWMPEQTIAMAKKIITHMGIRVGNSLLDVGCARGYLVRAMRILGVNSFGYDISKWAVENCDEQVKPYISTRWPSSSYYHFVCSKDQAEHCRPKELTPLLNRLLSATKIGMLLIVPLSTEKDGPYVRKEDNMDSTHIIRWPLEVWLEYLQLIADDHGFYVKGSWDLPGIKPTAHTPLKSCGFFELRKMEIE